MAAEHGIELSALHGSGIAGRVTKRDLIGFLESGAPVPHPAALPSGVVVPAVDFGAAPTATAWPGDVVEPMSKLRRLTSDHMALARRVAAHVTTFHEIDLTRVTRVRAATRKAFEEQSGQKLTYLPFILHALVTTLKRHPGLNAAVNGTDVILRKRYNIGLAVALDPTGLIVPVIKNAEDLSLTGLAKAANDLAGRARAKKLGPADATDATFTVSNFGTFGSLMGTPIIPVGTTAILGLGAIEKRPKVVAGPDGEDTIAIRTCAYFSLSFDHRVVDGADADRFMADLEADSRGHSRIRILTPRSHATSALDSSIDRSRRGPRQVSGTLEGPQGALRARPLQILGVRGDGTRRHVRRVRRDNRPGDPHRRACVVARSRPRSEPYLH